MKLGWLTRLVAARARNDARLLLVVLVVAIVACTAVTSLALLVAVTERGGLRSALGNANVERIEIGVTVVRPSVPITEVVEATTAAVDFVLADTVPSASTTFAQTEPSTADVVSPDLPAPAIAYFAEVEGVESAATIVEGEWPEMGTADALPVAIPQNAAEALALGVGDSLVVGDTTVVVAGLYRIEDAAAPLWASDRLAASGIDRGFPLPGVRDYVASDAFGPLIVAPGGLDAAGVTVQSADIRFVPDFGALEVDQLGAIANRLDDARTRIPARAGNIGEQVTFSSRLADTVEEAASGALVTRTTVLTVALLLLLVAIVALGQCARLVTDSRVDERRLLRARGCSMGEIRAATTIEALVIALVAAALAPPLASLVYRLVAVHPAMMRAGMPLDAGLPPLTWGAAAVTALLFVVVLMAPLARPAELFDDERGEQRAARRIRPLGLVRLGIDAAVAVLAVVVYQQLVSYRPPTGQPSVRLDPLLVASPALLLAACSYLAVRLVPVVAALLEGIGSRARGAVVSLASWEVGRRAQRATAVVLLLTLALAVGSFGATFLSTWRQSQDDQVALAFGAPGRVPVSADPVIASTQGEVLADGARGEPQPVLRLSGRVGGPSAGGSDTIPPTGPGAQILGLSIAARTLLDRGRIGSEGGSGIERMLRSDVPPIDSIPLPDGSRSLTATVQVGDPTAPFPGVTATVSAVIEDSRGVLGTVPLGTIPVDGAPYAVGGILPVGDSAALAGLVLDLGVDDSGAFQLRTRATPANLLIGNLGAAVVSGETVSLDSETARRWTAQARNEYQRPPQIVDPPVGWQLALLVSIPQDIDGRPTTYSVIGWEQPDVTPVVVSEGLAELLSARNGARLTLVVGGAQIPAQLIGSVPFVPGSGTAPGTPDGVDAATDAEASAAVVIDQSALARSLILAGETGLLVDEWWIDIPQDRGEQYLERHADEPAGVGAETTEVTAREQAEGPLRIATPAALALVIVVAGVLTVVGFAVHTAASMRSRRTEFAQLRAIGLARRSLVTVVGAESVLLSVLGTVFGLSIGVLLGSFVTPLVGLSPDGSAPRPAVELVVPFGGIAALVVSVALAVVAVVLVVAGRQRSADPAAILRGAGE